jgi:membrane protease YdiL (CAAX protease family)
MNETVDPILKSTDTARESRWLASAELAIAAGLVVGANLYDIVPISETPWLVLLGWISLRFRGLRWRSVGFCRPPRLWTTIALALVAGIGLQLLSAIVLEPVIEQLTGQRADLSDFTSLVGNLPECLVMLGLIWTLAAFGEELGYRGYILNRAAAIGRGTPAAYAVSLVVVSVLFGLGHWYQGPAGVCGSTMSGLYFGGLYLASGRNLWLPILAHGFSDTIALAMIYFGWVTI